jgi:hypothetical protein
MAPAQPSTPAHTQTPTQLLKTAKNTLQFGQLK